MALNKGSWVATATSSEIVASSNERGSVIIQMTSNGDAVSLGLGEDAVFGEGIQLINAGDFAEIAGHWARQAINAICDAGNSSSGGYQES